MQRRMDAAGAVDAQNAPTAPWKTAQNAVSHSAHTHHRFQEQEERNEKLSTSSTHEIPDTPPGPDGTHGCISLDAHVQLLEITGDNLRSLLDALDGQREDRLHRRSAAINVQQLPGDEARLVGAEENHGVADIGWQAEAPHGRPAALRNARNSSTVVAPPTSTAS